MPSPLRFLRRFSNGAPRFRCIFCEASVCFPPANDFSRRFLIPFPGRFWLENWRFEVQSGWLGLFVTALGLSIFHLYLRSRNFRWDAELAFLARGFWAFSIAVFFGMWIAGATLEMMRRAAPLSGAHLMVALAAFSLLLTGTFVLVREGFGATWQHSLRARQMTFALGILTLAGWLFGGFALEWNALWNFAPPGLAPFPFHSRAPDGWALSLGGAALWSASAMVQSADESELRVKNPRAATWFLAGVALLLMLPWGARNPLAASVFVFGAGIFSFKIWRARADCPRFLRSNWRLRGPILLLLTIASFFVEWRSLAFWMQGWRARTGATWSIPLHCVAFGGLLLAIFWLLLRGRKDLRTAISRQFSQRALLDAALGGFFLAALFFGPAGAVFWAFWPLAGVFFDRLSPREI